MSSWKLSTFDDGENEHAWRVTRTAEGYRCEIVITPAGDLRPSAPDVLVATTIDELVRELETQHDPFLRTAADRLAEMIRHG